MKLFNCKKFILQAAVFYCIYNIYSCAAIQSPSGGPKDNTPPILLGSIPESGTIKFEGGKVELMFSEYLLEKSLSPFPFKFNYIICTKMTYICTFYVRNIFCSPKYFIFRIFI